MNINEKRPAGYQFFIRKFFMEVIPNWHCSYVSYGSVHHIKENDGLAEEVYPEGYWPGDTIGDHLEFALKYDGVNLGLLHSIFKNVTKGDIVEFIDSKPTGKYARMIWFFYEFLTGKELPLADLDKGNYIEALDPKRYFALAQGKNSKRHRIVNNLPGPREFCPIIRRTEKLEEFESYDLREKCETIIRAYPPELLRRALAYLYNKETKSSFAIENVKPNTTRAEKFIAALELAEKEDFCKKELLVDLQNRIVNQRFCDNDYRTKQNYVGQTVTYQKEVIHYISPRPEDVRTLMDGLIMCHNMMKEESFHPVLHAAAISYGFVFIHPFEDGNGRIHRFLIHNILSVQGLVPKGLMFPVSAVMLKEPAEYDDSLEAFSRPLMNLVDYTLDETGNMEVKSDTSHLYRYIDMTAQAEALYGFINKTIEFELAEELDFLVNYDKTKSEIQAIIDMPDRRIDLIIHLCLDNNKTLSKSKREKHFNFLSDDEVAKIEQAVKEGYRKD